MNVTCHYANYSRLSLIQTLFLSPSKPWLIRIPDKANKFRRSPGVRTNESILNVIGILLLLLLLLLLNTYKH